jgi:hypothetical protein
MARRVATRNGMNEDMVIKNSRTTGTPVKPAPEKLVAGSPSIYTDVINSMTGMEPTINQVTKIAGKEMR